MYHVKNSWKSLIWGFIAILAIPTTAFCREDPDSTLIKLESSGKLTTEQRMKYLNDRQKNRVDSLKNDYSECTVDSLIGIIKYSTLMPTIKFTSKNDTDKVKYVLHRTEWILIEAVVFVLLDRGDKRAIPALSELARRKDHSIGDNMPDRAQSAASRVAVLLALTPTYNALTDAEKLDTLFAIYNAGDTATIGLYSGLNSLLSEIVIDKSLVKILHDNYYKGNVSVKNAVIDLLGRYPSRTGYAILEHAINDTSIIVQKHAIYTIAIIGNKLNKPHEVYDLLSFVLTNNCDETIKERILYSIVDLNIEKEKKRKHLESITKDKNETEKIKSLAYSLLGSLNK